MGDNSQTTIPKITIIKSTIIINTIRFKLYNQHYQYKIKIFKIITTNNKLSKLMGIKLMDKK